MESGLYRIIDANLNRASEGLRVVEDLCRFLLETEGLCEAVKTIRHKLPKLVGISPTLLAESRSAGEDIGRNRPVPQRKNIRAVLTANLKRATEAFRVLEEILPNGSLIKDERYILYDLERPLRDALRLKMPFEHDIYVVGSEVNVLKKAVLDGAAIVQLRDKENNLDIIKQKSLELVRFRQDHDFVFMINDYPELVGKVGADGVHIGQDYDTREARNIIGPQKVLGKTTHNLDQAWKAKTDGANYISVGPVYPTPTKPGRPAVGVEYVSEVATAIDIPFVAIGGINLDNIDQVLAAGAKTIGIVRVVDQVPKLLEKIRSVPNV